MDIGSVGIVGSAGPDAGLVQDHAAVIDATKIHGSETTIAERARLEIGQSGSREPQAHGFSGWLHGGEWKKANAPKGDGWQRIR